MTSFELNLELGEASDAIRAGAARGLTQATEYLLTEANKVVPHQEGTLERSGQASVDRANLTGAVSYDTPYAVRQHEDMTLRHEGGRSAKYLENTLDQHGTRAAEVIAQAIRSEVG